MEGLKAKLDAFKRSKVGQFLTKFSDDQATSLAALLAWGTLSTMLPLVLGIIGIAGLILRDPARINQIYDLVSSTVPSGVAAPLEAALERTRSAAAPASILSLVVLLFNGSSFFANMASVFDRVYHVESRNFVLQRAVSVVMLVIITALLVISTLALGFGSIVDSLPIDLPFGPILGRVLSWSLAIISAFVLFVLLYKLLPNAKQGWRNVVPGAITAMVLAFVITLLFPVYLAIFPPNQAYAIFGIFLVFTFWLYLLGIVFVLGAELNAFLLEPSRSVAMAEATEQAEHGKAQIQARQSGLRADAEGTAPPMHGSAGSPRQQLQHQQQPGGQVQEGGTAQASQPAPTSTSTSITGKLLGFVGLMLAAVLVRGSENAQQRKQDRARPQPARP